MIAGFPNTLYGKPGRDEEIEEVKQSIRAAAKLAFPSLNTTSTRIAQLKATTTKWAEAEPASPHSVRNVSRICLHYLRKACTVFRRYGATLPTSSKQ